MRFLGILSCLVVISIATFIATVGAENDTTVAVISSVNSTTGAGPAEVEEPIISQKNATTSEGKTKRTCACDDAAEALICASNGITYKSTCRFNCARARVSRLRVVKQGACSTGSGTGAYWQKGFKG